MRLVSKMVRLFWRDLEIHEPSINSLHLSDAVARRWKQRLSPNPPARKRPPQMINVEKPGRLAASARAH
jgi:hypothetical protein